MIAAPISLTNGNGWLLSAGRYAGSHDWATGSSLSLLPAHAGHFQRSPIYGLANVRAQLACIHQCCGEEQLTKQWAEAAITLATEHGFPYRVAVGTMLRGWAMSALGQHEEGIAQLHEGLAACQVAGAMTDYPYFLGLLAETCGRSGQVDEGLAALAEAQMIVLNSRTFFYEAELYRLKGALLLQASPSRNADEAEACFRQALCVARRQKAKSPELRAAISLSRLWHQQGKRTEAHQLLAEVYSWFTEGFDTVDLQLARALLVELEGEGESPGGREQAQFGIEA